MAVASWAYDATAGVNYSNSYWWHRNPSYAQFGNDCANFLSQTLKSAGAQFLGAPTGSGSHNIPSQWLVQYVFVDEHMVSVREPQGFYSRSGVASLLFEVRRGCAKSHSRNRIG